MTTLERVGSRATGSTICAKGRKRVPNYCSCPENGILTRLVWINMKISVLNSQLKTHVVNMGEYIASRIRGSLALLAPAHVGARRAVINWLEMMVYLLIAAVFLLMHYGDLGYLKMPIYRPDWSGYFKVLQDIWNGELPDATTRPFGYPLFVAIVYKVFGSHLAVTYAQSLIKLVSLLYLTWVGMRINRPFGFVLGVAMLAVAGRYSGVTLDARILTDSLYSGIAILSIAFLVRGLWVGRWQEFAAAATCVGLLVWIKPAGHWALVSLVIALVLGCLGKRIAWRQGALAVFLPVLLILGGLTLYNGLTAGTWKTSAYGGANLAGATWFYWKQSDEYPDKVNQLVETIGKNSTNCRDFPRRCIDRRDVQTLATSTDLADLAKAYRHLYGFWGHVWRLGLQDYFESQWGSSGHQHLKHAEPMLYDLSIDAIQSNPRVYIATVLASLYLLDFHYASQSYDFEIAQIEKRLERNTRFFKRGWAQSNPALALGQFDLEVPQELKEKVASIKDGDVPWLIKMAKSYHNNVQESLFNSSWYGVVYYLTLAISGAGLLITRGRNAELGVAFIISTAAFGSSLIVALVEIGNPKYGEPTMALNFASIACLIFLLGRFSQQLFVMNERVPRSTGLEDSASVGSRRDV